MAQRSNKHGRPVVKVVALDPDRLEQQRFQLGMLVALAAAVCLAIVLAVVLWFGPSSASADPTVADAGSPDAAPPAVLAQFD